MERIVKPVELRILSYVFFFPTSKESAIATALNMNEDIVAANLKSLVEHHRLLLKKADGLLVANPAKHDEVIGLVEINGKMERYLNDIGYAFA
jgi:hypothetical protein